MKKLIVYSFAIIFMLFTLGAGMTVYYLFTTSRGLNELITLHEIADIPKELNLNVQKIKFYVYAPPEDFTEHLDDIIDLGNRIDESVRKCHACHQDSRVAVEIAGVEADIIAFEQRLSFLITCVSEGEWRSNNQRAVAVLADKIRNTVEDMDARVARIIKKRTESAMGYFRRVYTFLVITLVVTFLLALYVARYLSRKVTAPIKQLLTAAHKIRDGELGNQIAYRGVKEFGELIQTFNEMNQALAGKEKRIESSLTRLEHLSQATLPLHTAHSLSSILVHVGWCMTNLIEVEQKGMMLVDQDRNCFVLYLSIDESPDLTAHSVEIPLSQVMEVYRSRHGNQIVINTTLNSVWPFGEKPADVSNLRNLLLVWLVVDQKLIGALLAINRSNGDFSLEDVNVFEILANNIAAAFANIELYTNLHKRMEELQQAQRQLFEAEKLTAIGTLAGGIAHDFNNILCGMIGHLALMKKKLDPESRGYKTIDIVEQAGFRAAGLTRQLLAFSRQDIVEKKPVDLNESVRQVISILENTFSKLITINLVLPENLPLIMGDSNQLEQVVINLCVNSRDALPNGGTITITTEAVRLDESGIQITQYPWVSPGQFVKLSVNDTGDGIRKEDIPRIFEPFFTTKEFGKGTGLGLSIVYGIIKSHKGFCVVDSLEGKGTTFEVYLPIADQLFRENPLAIVDWNICVGTILIVDDEFFVSSMLSEYLHSHGCITFVANNGEEAIRIFNEKKDTIDVVVLDINMPVMDGGSAFEAMKKIKPDVKVIVSTGYGNDGLSRKILEAGAQGYIQKPYSLEVLAQTIAQVLGDNKGDRLRRNP